MAKLRHAGVEGTVEVPDRVLPFWTQKAGWVPTDEPVPASSPDSPEAARKRTRPPRRRAASKPATVESIVAPDALAPDTTNPEE